MSRHHLHMSKNRRFNFARTNARHRYSYGDDSDMFIATARSAFLSGHARDVQAGTENDSNIRLSSCQLIKTTAGHSFVNI